MADEAPPKSIVRELSPFVRVNLLVSGTAAWVLTVAVPVFSAPTSPLVRALAVLALLPLGVGVWLLGGGRFVDRFPRATRRGALWGFVGTCTLSWVLCGEILLPEQQPAVRAAVGAVAWLSFALGWGAVRSRNVVPENDPRAVTAELLAPRKQVERITWIGFGVAVAGALTVWLAAWRGEQREHALLAHSCALAAASWLLGAGADIAVALGTKRRQRPSAVRLQQASGPLIIVALCALLGVIYWKLAARS